MSELFRFTFAVCFIAFIGDIGTTIYLPVLPELNQVFAVSSTLIKFSITIYYIGILVGTAFSGPLSDTYGRQHTLNFFLSLFIISSVLCALSTVIYPFLAGRFLQGIGAAGAPIIALSISADSYKGDVYDKIASFILITIAIGPGSAPLIGGLIFKIFGWQMIFYFLASMGILALGLSYYAKIEHRIERQEITKTLHEYLFFLHHPSFRYYWAMIGILYGAFYAFLIISPYIFRVHYGWSILEFASASLLLAIANGLGPLFNEALIEKLGSNKITLSGLTIVTTTLCLFFFAEQLSHGIWLLILAALFIIGGNLIAACLTLKAIKVDPNFTGLASSLIILGKMMGAALVLIGVLFFPENIWTINYFFLTALAICIFGYLKIRKIL